MRSVIQRVSSAKVIINRNIERKIKKGLVIFLAIEENDEESDMEWLAKKILSLRIFEDKSGIMNLNIEEIKGEIMCISQFTLFASTKKGNRPSYSRAAPPLLAKPLYEKFLKILKDKTYLKIENGEFGAYMQVSLTNDGPVTILIDTKNKE